MLEHWLGYFNAAAIVFGAGGAVALLYQLRHEVRDLWHKMNLLDRREANHHQRYLVILTTLVAAHNPGNPKLLELLQDLAGNNAPEP